MATLAIRYSTGTQATAYTTALWLHSSTGTFDEGWKIRYDGWIPGIAQRAGDGWTNVDEKVTLKIVGTTGDDLSAKLQKLDTIIDDLDFHIKSNSARVYWLFTALTGESNYFGGIHNAETNDQLYRICPIIGVSSSYNRGVFGLDTDRSNIILQYTITIKRLPLWEGEAYDDGFNEKVRYNLSDSEQNVSTVGGTYTLLGEVNGNAPARIVNMSLFALSGYGGPMTEAWVGFRGAQLGDPTLFVPVWEMEDTGVGNLGADTTLVSESSDTSPVGSTSNNKLRCTFSTTTTMAYRAILTLADVTTSAQRNDQRGRHLVLLRAKVDGDRTAYVRMDSAYSGATNWRTGTRLLVDSTNWYFYALGYITIPGTRMTETEAQFGAAITFNNFGIRINAQSASGSSGNLDMDCLVLIPQDEGAAYINKANIAFVSDSIGTAYIHTDPLGNIYATSHPAGNDGNVTSMLETQTEHFILPTGDDVAVILAAQRTSSQVLADLLGVTIDARFRWRSLRGSDGFFVQ